jgi:hypothetical protein
MKLFLLVLFSVCLIPSIANAQSLYLQGKFRLRNEVRWGKALLPAGDYSLTVDSRFSATNRVYAIVRSADGRKVAVAIATATGRPAPGGCFIFITSDETRQVRLLNLPERNVSLAFGPLSNGNREQLYAAKIEVVPVTLAGK